MVGVCGGHVTSTELEEMQTAMVEEDWYETTSLTTDDYAVGALHHGSDATEPAVIDRPDLTGVLFGTVTNRDDDTAVFEELASDPPSALADFNGSFLLVWADEDGFNVATDCLTSVSCLYRETDDGVVFGNELGAVVESMDEPRLDIDAAAEFLARDFVFGERTLVEGVKRLQPATILRVEAGELSTERYWKPSYDIDENPASVESVLECYREEVRSVAETTDGGEGIFLTGGLDSRLLAGVLEPELETFDTVTFDYNPVKKNLGPAGEVADLLGVSNSVERHTPEEFADIVRRGVKLTNGMVHWRNFFAFPFALNESRERFDTLIANFGQGEFFGEYLTPAMLNTGTPFETLSTDTQKRGAASFFSDDVDLERGLRSAVDSRTGSDDRETVHDVFLTSFYPWFHFSKMNLHRSQLNVELVMTNTDLLDAAVRIPDEKRRRPADVPLVNTMLPTAPAKYELVRTVDDGLEDIPSNSLLPVDYPLLLHTVAYNTWRSIPSASLRKPHFGFLRKAHRYREWLVHSETFRSFVDDLLESAASRECFNKDRIEEIQSEEYSHPFKSHIEEISAITSIEVLIQEFDLRC